MLNEPLNTAKIVYKISSHLNLQILNILNCRLKNGSNCPNQGNLNNFTKVPIDLTINVLKQLVYALLKRMHALNNWHKYGGC